MKLTFVLGAGLGLALCLTLPASAESADPCHTHGILLISHHEINGSLANDIGEPGTTAETRFMGYVDEVGYDRMKVSFGYIQPKNPGVLQDGPQRRGGRHECVQFHFNPPAAEGGARVGAQIENGSPTDSATVTVWRLN